MMVAVESVVLNYIREVMRATHIFSLLADAVTSVDCQGWISIHRYVVVHWRRMPNLLTLERVVDGGMADNLTAEIVKATKTYGGLIAIDIQEKLITFWHGLCIHILGCQNRVTFQLCDFHLPYMIGVHCMAHWTNLAVQTLSEIDMVKRVEELLGSLFTYLNSSLKWRIKF